MALLSMLENLLFAEARSVGFTRGRDVEIKGNLKVERN
jgi:hypothetical protein